MSTAWRLHTTQAPLPITEPAARDVAKPGTLTYEIVKELVDDIVLVTEDDIRHSMVDLIQRNKVIFTKGREYSATRC